MSDSEREPPPPPPKTTHPAPPPEPELPGAEQQRRVSLASTLLREGLRYGCEGTPAPKPPEGKRSLMASPKHVDLLAERLRDRDRSPQDVVCEILRTLDAWARLVDRGKAEARGWGPGMLSIDRFGVVESEVDEATATRKPRHKPRTLEDSRAGGRRGAASPRVC